MRILCDRCKKQNTDFDFRDEWAHIEFSEKGYGKLGDYYLCPKCASDYRKFIDNETVIESMPKVGEWIPVSERLPEKKGEYLFTTNSYSGVTIEIYIFDPENNRDAEFAKTGMDLMAWMPLPEAYKEEI